MLEQGIYDKDTFLERQSYLKNLISIEINRITELEREDKIRKARADYNERLIPELENLLKVYDTLPDAKSKNDLIKKLFYQIQYSKTTKGNRWNQELVDDFKLKFISRVPSLD